MLESMDRLANYWGNITLKETRHKAYGNIFGSGRLLLTLPWFHCGEGVSW